MSEPKNTKTNPMQTRHQLLLGTAGLCMLASLVQAQPSAHYVPGVEGIKGASLPPPGWYVRDYNVAYTASRLNGPNGNEIPGMNLGQFVYANVPRVIWITETKLLGGFVGVDALIPLAFTSTAVGPSDQRFEDMTFGVGDLFVEGTLSWHPKQFDFSFGAGVYMPTGDSPYKPGPSTRAGLGYWTPMLTAGSTWYIDKEKTWAVSALNRYEINTEQRDTDVTYGQAYTLEWGVSKTVAKFYDLGVVGYYQQQVTPTSGLPASARNRVAAIGPEISVVCPKCMTFVSLRYDYEFMAEDRAQGHTFCLTVTKKF
jgi:hypothetical protein